MSVELEKIKGDLDYLGYCYEIETSEHPGCWGKSCEGEHLIEELIIWKSGEPNRKIAFSDSNADYILKRLITHYELTDKS